MSGRVRNSASVQGDFALRVYRRPQRAVSIQQINLDWQFIATGNAREAGRERGRKECRFNARLNFCRFTVRSAGCVRFQRQCLIAVGVFCDTRYAYYVNGP